jgi:hypothetical protein
MDNLLAINRASLSVTPPAAHGTIILTGLLGQLDWAMQGFKKLIASMHKTSVLNAFSLCIADKT